MPDAIDIRTATAPDDIADLRQLFEAYQASLDIDLAYQDFDTELAGLPGIYAPPAGTLLLARDAAGRAIGCVALKPLAAPGVGEIKRLYVTPRGRGHGLGRALLGAVIAEARRIGYRELRLDTLPSMTTAQALYRSVGFLAVPAYYETPVADTVFMGLRLVG